jgi:4'-phosphopantetheinyl transferase
MVYLFYHKYAAELNKEIFDRVFDKFPPPLQTQILKLNKKEDRNRKLLGRMLLTEAFKFLGIDCQLNQILYSPQHRPYFNSSFDFNISHSGSVVVCAISKVHKVGIDVEEIKSVSLNDFKNHFSKTDWEFIMASHQPQKTFYNLWTKREAFLKAIGIGLAVDLKSIDANWALKNWENMEWRNTEITLDQNYSCHLCVNHSSPEVIMREIYPE